LFQISNNNFWTSSMAQEIYLKSSAEVDPVAKCYCNASLFVISVSGAGGISSSVPSSLEMFNISASFAVEPISPNNSASQFSLSSLHVGISSSNVKIEEKIYFRHFQNSMTCMAHLARD
jgi:hypothetical protein